jgi:hypothetical protein
MAGLLVVAAIVRFRALDFGLPHTQARPDETAIIEPVRTLLSGHLPRFYDYPWLFLFVLCVAYLGYFVWGTLWGTFHSISEMLASWPLHWAPFFLISRAISAAIGSLSILVVFRLGRQIRDDATGILSALFLTFTFMHARSSHFGTTDIAMTFLIVCAVSLLLDAHRTRSRRRFAGAGLVAGLAAGTKYSAVVLVVPMLVSHVLTVFDSPGRRGEALRDDRILYFGVAFALAFGIGVPFVLIDRAPFFEAMGELAHALTVGDPRLDLSNGWLHHLTFSLRYGIGLPLLVTGLAGAVALLWLEPRVAALLLSFPVVYYALAGSFKLLFFRYAMPILPFLCVTAAYLICRVSAWFAAQRFIPSPRRAVGFRAAAAVLAIAIVWSSAVRTWAFDRVMSEEDSRVVVARWFFDHVPSGSSVLQSGSRYGLVQFWDRRFQYNEWRWDSARRVFLLNGNRLSKTVRPDWIIVQDSPLPSSTQEIVTELFTEDYVRVATVNAFSPSDDLVYDQQDAFFVPFTGFEHVVRPGPNFTIYKHHVRP